MSEIRIPTLAPKIIGADLNAPETADSRRGVPHAAICRTVGEDLVVSDGKEARAYLSYLAAHDGGDPTRISAGSWAHRTLFGLAQSARQNHGPKPPHPSELRPASERRPAPKIDCALVELPLVDPGVLTKPEHEPDLELELVDPNPQGD